MTRIAAMLVAVLVAVPAHAGDSDEKDKQMKEMLAPEVVDLQQLVPSPPAVAAMLAATGGAKAPYGVDSIAFTFAVDKDGKLLTSRRHVWHPRTGNHEVSGKTREGAAFAIHWNLNTRIGTATQGGRELAGKELEDALDRAWKLWVNDTYWLLMPYKLEDKGVVLQDEGEVTVDGTRYDKVKVTFGKVGLTPGDTYWAYISPTTHRVERWAFVLEGQQPPPVEWRWSGYGKYGPLTLATRKEQVGSTQVIRTDEIEVH